jgi:hypothetical protein
VVTSSSTSCILVGFLTMCCTPARVHLAGAGYMGTTRYPTYLNPDIPWPEAALSGRIAQSCRAPMDTPLLGPNVASCSAALIPVKPQAGSSSLSMT